MLTLSLKEKNELARIARKYSLTLVLLFGSRVIDKKFLHQESDFDVAYLSSRPLNLEEESRLIVDLAPIFRSENVDLVNLKKAPPLLFYAVFNRCQVLYERNSFVFALQRVYAFKKYIETKPLYEERFRRLEREIKSL